MIIFGGIGSIFALISLLTIGALLALAGAAWLAIMGAILIFGGSIVQLIAGILGVKNAGKPEKAQVCINCGIIVMAFIVIGQIASVAGGGNLDVWGLLWGLVLPVLYLIGAFQNKKLAEVK